MCPYSPVADGAALIDGSYGDRRDTCTPLRWSWMSLLVTFALFAQPAMAVPMRRDQTVSRSTMWLPEMRTTRSYMSSSSGGELSKPSGDLQSDSIAWRPHIAHAWLRWCIERLVSAIRNQRLLRVRSRDLRVRTERDDGLRDYASDAMLGQFFYVFAHEMGHAVYDVLKIPVLGFSCICFNACPT